MTKQTLETQSRTRLLAYLQHARLLRFIPILKSARASRVCFRHPFLADLYRTAAAT